MELKPGYKQTEVGVIPEDWGVISIGKACRLINGRGFKPHEWENSGLPIIRIQNLNGSNEYNYFSGDYDSKIEVHEGQLLFAWSGSRGTSFGPHIWHGPKALLNYHTWKVAINEKVLEPDYFYHALKKLTSFIEDKAHGASALVHTQKWEMEKFPIAVPTCTLEQADIANALSSCDKLLSDLEALLRKKRNIKQAAMQELLTGKRRLPGSQGEWEVKRLGEEIRDLEAGVSVRSTTDKDQLSTGRYILKTSAVSQGQFSPTERKEIISCDISRAKTPIKQGDLIISRMNTPSLVGECGYSQLDHPNLFLPDRLWRTAYRDPHAVSSRWLAYTLSTQHNRARIKELATGTSGSMKNISKRALLNLEIKWPSMEEQIAIAEVLSEMDSDIDSLNDQLQKAQGIKQGMMQQLLTGKIRLK